MICGVTLGERGTWWFDGQRLQLTPHARCMQSTRWAPATPWHGALAFALAEKQPLREALQFATDVPRSSARGLAGAMASPLATRSMRFRATFC